MPRLTAKIGQSRAATAGIWFATACRAMAKILIVDDNPDESEGVSRYLHLSGHQVASAPNGRQALTQVLENQPDVILLDLMLPEMDGPSFLEVVRSYLRLQSMPVVILTGLPDSPLIDRAHTLKVSKILAKGTASSEDIKRALEEAAAHATS